MAGSRRLFARKRDRNRAEAALLALYGLKDGWAAHGGGACGSSPSGRRLVSRAGLGHGTLARRHLVPPRRHELFTRPEMDHVLVLSRRPSIPLAEGIAGDAQTR